MDLKTFRAATMADALADVKRELGPDAVILHTRAVRRGGVMGVGARPLVEVTASAASAAPEIAAARRARAAARSGAAYARHAALVATGAPATTPGAMSPASVFTPETWKRPDRDATAAAPEQAPATRRPAKPPEGKPPEGKHADRKPAGGNPAAAKPADFMPLVVKAEFAPVDQATVDSLADELASIKRLVGQVLRCSRQTAVQIDRVGSGAGGTSRASGTMGGQSADAVLALGGVSDPLFANYARLLDGQVSTDIAEQVLAAARESLTGAEVEDAQAVRRAFLERLSALFCVDGGATALSGGAVLALIGPTGVGKTTTIAKLAAMLKLRHARRVGLITCDTYRIAAVEQLRTYAGIIGLPLRVAATPDEVASARRAMRDCDVVLLDTAGRAPTDSSRLGELAAVLEAAAPTQTHLVLSAPSSEAVVTRAVERFAALKPDRLLVSKLDEAVHFGHVLNVCVRTRLPVAYLTTGQEVPDHIEAATAARLARLVLDGELASEGRT